MSLGDHDGTASNSSRSASQVAALPDMKMLSEYGIKFNKCAHGSSLSMMAAYSEDVESASDSDGILYNGVSSATNKQSIFELIPIINHSASGPYIVRCGRLYLVLPLSGKDCTVEILDIPTRQHSTINIERLLLFFSRWN